jgi:hypothetical protein
MTWLTWRQHRGQLIAAAAILSILAVFLVTTERSMTSYLHTTGLGACLASQRDCGAISQLFENRYSGLLGDAAYLNFLPLLVGLFWGAPLIARELEHGTHRLVWTQTVSRRRWLTVKLITFVSAAVIAALTLSRLLSWWFGPFAHVGFGQGFSRMDVNIFDFEGIVPIGYTLFALALGTAAGVVIRRTVPAMVITVTGFLVARFGVQALRGHFLTPLQASYPPFGQDPLVRHGDWVIQTHLVDRLGHTFPDQLILQTCPGSGPETLRCAIARGIHQVDLYQPVSRFWAFQEIEFAIFLALTIALIGVTLWWTIRRTS